MKCATLLLLVGAVCLTQQATADSIRQSFEKLREKKRKDNRMTSKIKGAICTSDGMSEKDFKRMPYGGLKEGEKPDVKYLDWKRTRGVCWNGHGPRCDTKGFLKEKECYYQQVNGKCCTYPGGRPGLYQCRPYPLREHKELSEKICPQPCGCIFSGKPKRKSSSTNKVQKLKVKGGGCSSKSNWEQVRKVLDDWDVPKETYSKFEIGTLMDRNDFLAFDYFIQPNKNTARYGIAFGATRCHGDTIEFGYMNTGMWEIETNAQRRCSSGGGKHSCHSTGIDNDQVETGRETLEYYAWDNLGNTDFRGFDVHTEDWGEPDTPSFPSFRHDSDAFENFVNDEDSDEMDAYDFAPASYPGPRQQYSSWSNNLASRDQVPPNIDYDEPPYYGDSWVPPRPNMWRLRRV